MSAGFLREEVAKMVLSYLLEENLTSCVERFILESSDLPQDLKELPKEELHKRCFANNGSLLEILREHVSSRNKVEVDNDTCTNHEFEPPTKLPKTTEIQIEAQTASPVSLIPDASIIISSSISTPTTFSFVPTIDSSSTQIASVSSSTNTSEDIDDLKKSSEFEKEQEDEIICLDEDDTTSDFVRIATNSKGEVVDPDGIIYTSMRLYKPSIQQIYDLRKTNVPFYDIKTDGKCVTRNSGGDWRKMLTLREVLNSVGGWSELDNHLIKDPDIAVHWASNNSDPGQMISPLSFQFGSPKNFRKVQAIVLKHHGIKLVDRGGKKRKKIPMHD